MSKSVSLKIKDEILKETEEILKKIDIPRNSYINHAIAYYNELNRKKSLAKILNRESKLVSKESKKVLEEFEFIEKDLL
ncbi:MAG: hypothetical protein COS84_06795 [Armatimonadetes bacterium CG07_land_8_20_14_0_80_40_9]|nr:MAG: hypothetical protein COS84_06795 [Armatimonadetes bacterium CG07_land_8_20_14_0_80_40_9]